MKPLVRTLAHTFRMVGIYWGRKSVRNLWTIKNTWPIVGIECLMWFWALTSIITRFASHGYWIPKWFYIFCLWTFLLTVANRRKWALRDALCIDLKAFHTLFVYSTEFRRFLMVKNPFDLEWLITCRFRVQVHALVGSAVELHDR